MSTYRCIGMSVLGLIVSSAAIAGEPLVVAHRGLLMHAPENTLSNFRACLELRLGFEFDVARTKDGEMVCVHDETVNRTTNGSGKVAEMTLAELRKLDAGRWFHTRFAGERIPTIDEVLQLLADYNEHHVLIAVDLKAASVEKDVVALARRNNVLHRLLFIGRAISEPNVRKALLTASPDVQCAAVANNPGEFRAALDDSWATWVYFRYLPTKEQLQAVHSHRKRAFIAGTTVSGFKPENWRQSADAGIDGILTDYPLELRKALSSQ